MLNLRWLGLSLLLALGACTTLATPGSAQQEGFFGDKRTVYIVRHLQKAAGDDPELTPEGAAAAQRLAELLADEGIGAIYATPTRRARQTGEPLARLMGLEVTEYDPRNPSALVEAAAAIEGAVLIVGHSNTVGDLVSRFGGVEAPQLTEQDYGTIFAVSPDGAVRELVLE